MTEEERDRLLRRLQQDPRSDQAWTLFIAAVSRDVLYTLQRCKCPRDMATDILQESLLRFVATDTLKKVESMGRAVAWLRTTAKHLYIDSTRSRKGHVPLDDVDEKRLEIPDQSEIEYWRQIGIARLARGLKESDQALLLHLLNGTSQDEMASELGITMVNLRARIHRLRERLKELAGENERSSRKT